jgi:hypothetical protein
VSSLSSPLLQPSEVPSASNKRLVADHNQPRPSIVKHAMDNRWIRSWWIALFVAIVGFPLWVPASVSAAVKVSSVGPLDPACNAGNPLFVHQRISEIQGLLAATSTHSVLAVAVETDGDDPNVVVRAFLPNCRPDRDFGVDGVTRINPPRAGYGSISAIARGPNGGWLLAGGNAAGWLIGLLDAHGKIDDGFGVNGWADVTPPVAADTVLAGSPTADALFSSTSGDIYAGGSDGGPHCCVQSYVLALNSEGQPLATFGDHGWVEVLPTGTFLNQVIPIEGGDIAVDGLLAFTGCGTSELTVLNPDGEPVPSFSSGISDTLGRLGQAGGLFESLIYARSGGKLGVVGAEIHECTGALLGPSDQYDVSASIGIDGVLDSTFAHGGQVRYPYQGGPESVAPAGRGRIMVASEGNEPIHGAPPLTLQVFTSQGLLDRRYGTEGVENIDVARVTHGVAYPQYLVVQGPDSTDDVIIGSGFGITMYRVRLRS